MDSAKKIIATILVLSIALFTLLAVLSIWNVLSDDVASKSLATLGVIFVAAVLSLITMKIVESKSLNDKL